MVEIMMDTHSTLFIQPASGAPPPPVHALPYPPVDSPFNIHPACLLEMVSLLEEKQRRNEYVISQARCVCTCKQTKYTTAVT